MGNHPSRIQGSRDPDPSGSETSGPGTCHDASLIPEDEHAESWLFSFSLLVHVHEEEEEKKKNMYYILCNTTQSYVYMIS